MLKAMLRHSIIHVIRFFFSIPLLSCINLTVRSENCTCYNSLNWEERLNSMYSTMSYVYLMIMIGECI